MKVKDACCWCWKPIYQPAGFDPIKGVIVCSDECLQYERAFRIQFSDKEIGERNMRDFGVNPNERGKHAKKGKKGT